MNVIDDGDARMAVEMKVDPIPAPTKTSAAMPIGARWRPRSSVLRVRSILYLLALDCLVIASSFLAAAGIRQGALNDGWLLAAAWLVPLYALIAFNVHAFAPATLQDPFVAIRRGVKALTVSMCALLVIAFT